MTRTLALELAAIDATGNCVNPGPTDTAMIAEALNSNPGGIQDQITLG